MPARPSFTAPTVNNLGQVVVYDTDESRMTDSNCPLFFRRELFYPNKLIRHQSEFSHVLTIRLNRSHTIGLLTPKRYFFGMRNHHRLLIKTLAICYLLLYILGLFAVSVFYYFKSKAQVF